MWCWPVDIEPTIAPFLTNQYAVHILLEYSVCSMLVYDLKYSLSHMGLNVKHFNNVLANLRMSGAFKVGLWLHSIRPLSKHDDYDKCRECKWSPSVFNILPRRSDLQNCFNHSRWHSIAVLMPFAVPVGVHFPAFD